MPVLDLVADIGQSVCPEWGRILAARGEAKRHPGKRTLIRRVDPVYSKLALRARIEGIVLLEVLIGPEGDVQQVDLIRGHPLLNEAAVAAVEQWKYSPTLLNGEPFPVIASVTVRFVLR